MSDSHADAKLDRFDLILGVLALVGFGLRGVLAAFRRYQVDEIEHVHAAFLMGLGKVPYRDFLEVHTPGLHLLLRPLVVADDPALTYGLARTLMALPGVGCMVLVVLVGRALGSLRAGLWGAALLGWHTTFAERGMEVRPDAWIALATLAALFVELREWERPGRRACLAGLCVGAGLVFSQKAIFMAAGFGCIWLWRAAVDRDAKPLLVAVASALALPGVVAVGFVAVDAGPAFWERVVLRPAQAFLSQGDAARTRAFGPGAHLVSESLRNLVFITMVPVGAVVSWRGWKREDPPRRRRWLVFGVVQLSLIVYLLGNPYPYPYLHVAFLPAWAVLAGLGCAAIGERLGSRTSAVILTILAWLVIAWSYVPRVVAKSGDRYDAQVAIMEEVARITEPQDAVFDAVGMYFRPSAAYAFFMPEGVAAEYRAGIYPALVDDLRNSQAVAVIQNYRVAAYVPGRDQGFLATRFVHYRGNIHVLGASFRGVKAGEAIRFEVLATKNFRFTGPEGAIAVDGEPFTAGRLERGYHRIDVLQPLRGGVLIMDPPGQPRSDIPPQTLYVNFD